MDWFTSDLHFGHAKILGYCGRPWDSPEAMTLGLIARWNARVGAGDRVFVLGDFALYLRRPEVEAILEQLHGEKHLIKGNHDHRDVYRARGWASVEVFNRYNNGPLMIHIPQEAAMVTDSFGRSYSGLVLHGHTHGNKGRREREPLTERDLYTFYDVGVDVDAHSYAPVSMSDITNNLLGARL